MKLLEKEASSEGRRGKPREVEDAVCPSVESSEEGGGAGGVFISHSVSHSLTAVPASVCLRSADGTRSVFTVKSKNLSHCVFLRAVVFG